MTAGEMLSGIKLLLETIKENRIGHDEDKSNRLFKRSMICWTVLLKNMRRVAH